MLSFTRRPGGQPPSNGVAEGVDMNLDRGCRVVPYAQLASLQPPSEPSGERIRLARGQVLVGPADDTRRVERGRAIGRMMGGPAGSAAR